jgi:aminoglycoside/choline kinase family phosphotransferase
VQRLELIQQWLAGLFPGRPFSLAPASADASFRRYFRASFADGGTRIVMDAPPQHEDCLPFIHVAGLFGAAGAHVPRVIEQDLAQGFLLLDDLGSTTYLSALTPDNATELYGAATAALVRIQLASRPGALPEYDRALLLRELQLFPDWYVSRHLGTTLGDAERSELDRAFERILAVNLAEPKVFVHRDYHSRNLMLAEPNPGILDFQDAVYGPISYDLASLFKDAYVEWDEGQALDWLVRYWEEARRAGLPVARDFADFHRNYEWMGVQRHIKVLGIFARLKHRDGKDGYLKDMPLVARYLRRACERYRELGPLVQLLDRLEERSVQTGYTF